MDSQDIIALAQNEQAFRVYVIQKLNDYEVRLTSLESGQAEFRQEVIQRVDAQDFENRLLHSKIDGLQHTLYWGFALMGIILAMLQIFLHKSEQPQPQPQPQPIILQIPPYQFKQEQEQKSA